MAEELPLTGLLQRHADGDPDAFDKVFSLVYGELRRLASGQKRRQISSLDTTDLVHQAYLRLAGGKARAGCNREHFYAIAATAMRHLLIDHAKRRQRDKRGGQLRRVELDPDSAAIDREADSMIDLNRALDQLAKTHPEWVAVVECRHFVGLTEQEAADTLGISLRTVQRYWRSARAELRAILRPLGR